ncbi:nuclear transcription factor Y subunit B-3-like [Prosopis cineraria]|uniref:nuclear transcription factor Y subunit B-3-like n=1 Tax=Prosopis cineraria TaxID=364024 RepID=UPI00240F48F2|nr:nuclear transcription factor Y subunit B-3-like [Prosopis cineraria]
MTGKRNNQTSPVGSPTSGNISDSSSKEQDRFLPIANVSRIMKRALPANAKISKEAKETVQECVSEFISFITGEASDKCQREKRKTINGDDLLWAMTSLGFENYVGPLKVYLNNYRETEGDKSCVGTKQEDQAQTETDDGAAQINKLANSVSAKADVAGFNGPFYSAMSQAAPKSFTEIGLTGFRENPMNMAIAQNAVHNDADGNLRYRVEW